MSSDDSSSSNSSSFNNGQGQQNASTALQEANQGIVPGYWHQDLELFFICFCCFFTIVLIVARTWLRRRNSKKFSADDYWIMFAAFLTVPYWVCQVGTNRFGSGLHIEVVPASAGQDFLGFERGWAAYYFITSMIKISELMLILGILPLRFRKTRIFIYVLCGLIMALGLAVSLAWFFQCLPVASNFDWNVTATFCISFGPPRYAWVGLGILFDICIVTIPVVLLQKMMLKSHERTVLMLLFSANILATSILIAGLAGIYYTSNPVLFPDYTWLETIYIIMQNIETLAYTLGACAPVLYRTFAHKPSSQSSGRTRSWRLRNYKGSSRSKETSETFGTAPPSYRSNGGKNSFFASSPKPQPIYVGPGKGDFVMATHVGKGNGDHILASPTTQTSMERGDRERLNSTWKGPGGVV